MQRGMEAEAFVAELYLSDGWRILERNLRIGGAELDLVAERDGALRFVEVKAREPGDVLGFEVITNDKRQKLVRGARGYLQVYEDVVLEATFDVVLVYFDDEGMRPDRLEHAFDV